MDDMSDEGWEARMAARARERAVVRQVEGMLEDPHAGHHSHLRGNLSTCSCGAHMGVATIVVPDDPIDWDAFSCWICGERGVAGPYRPDDPNWRLP